MTEQLDAAVWQTRIASGPTVLTERMDSVGSVALGFWLQHGAAHEAPGATGISHLLEHMVFKGTARRSSVDLAREIEAIGGTLDAYTTHEHTSYQAWVPRQYLDLALDVLTDLVFEPVLRQADLELERRVVLEELARVQDTPEDLVFDLHASHLYNEHPYGSPILGSRESLATIHADDLRALHGSAYVPENLVVTSAGAVDHGEVVHALGDRLPNRGLSARAEVPEPPAGIAELKTVHREGTRQSHIVLGGHGVGYSDPLRYAVVLVGTVLGDGMSSRLFQRVREELGLAYSVFSYQVFYGLGGQVGAYAGTSPETLASTRTALLEELELLAEEGLSETEVRASKEQMKGQLILSLETTTARMNRLAALALYDEPYASLEGLAGRIDAIEQTAVQDACRLFHPNRLAGLELVPA